MSGQRDKYHRAQARLMGTLLLVMWMALGLQHACGDDDGGVCGDGQLDPGEACDEGPNPFFNPDCYCSTSCTWIGPLCGEACGDGVVSANEACDGAALGGQTCEGLGLPVGVLTCNDDCTLDTSLCGVDLCGNGTCNPGETHATCPADCPAESCGDCVCGPSESAASCPTDCPHASCLDQPCVTGEICYDTVCVAGTPACMENWQPPYTGWPNDSDLEPNGTVAGAITLPCGDDGVATDPGEYATRCPSRTSYTNGFMNLTICPAGEHDLYGLYLLAGEAAVIDLLFAIDPLNERRDLDLTVWRWDDTTQQPVELATAVTTNANESLTIDNATKGWHYVDVYGKCTSDMNYYTVSFTLNP